MSTLLLVGDDLKADGRCEDGRDALRKADGKLPEPVITDFEMPEMDGRELCRHLQCRAVSSNIAVVLLSGHARTYGRRAGGPSIRGRAGDEARKIAKRTRVETESQHAALLAAGVPFAQGYLYQRPVRAEQLAQRRQETAIP